MVPFIRAILHAYCRCISWFGEKETQMRVGSLVFGKAIQSLAVLSGGFNTLWLYDRFPCVSGFRK